MEISKDTEIFSINRPCYAKYLVAFLIHDAIHDFFTSLEFLLKVYKNAVEISWEGNMKSIIDQWSWKELYLLLDYLSVF